MTQLKAQTLTDISSSHTQLLSICDWFAISLPDAASRQSFAQFRKRLESVIHTLSQPPGLSFRDLAEWFQNEAQFAKDSTPLAESVLSRMSMDLLYTILYSLSLTWRKLDGGYIDRFAIAIRALLTGLQACSEAMAHIPISAMMDLPQSVAPAPASVCPLPPDQIFYIHIPSDPIALTIEPPNVAVSVTTSRQSATFLRDSEGKLIGIESN